MKKYLSKVFALIFLSVLFASCGKAETIQTLPTVERQNPLTISQTPNASPTIELIITPTVIPSPTTFVNATVQSFKTVLCNSQVITWWEISPNGKWLTVSHQHIVEKVAPLQPNEPSLDRGRGRNAWLEEVAKRADPRFLPGCRWSEDLLQGNHRFIE